MPPPAAADHRAYPQGFLEYLTRAAQADSQVADHGFRQDGMDRFNAALHRISPGSPALDLGQMLLAARRALASHAGVAARRSSSTAWPASTACARWRPNQPGR